MTNHSRRSASPLGSAAQNLAESVGESIRELPQNVKDLNREFAQQATDGLSALSGMANDCLDQGRAKLNSIEQVIERRVRQQPLEALLIAFGIGAAFAFLARSRS